MTNYQNILIIIASLIIVAFLFMKIKKQLKIKKVSSLEKNNSQDIQRVENEEIEKTTPGWKNIYIETKDPTIIIDSDGVFQNTNSAFSNMVKYSKQELLGKSCASLIKDPFSKNFNLYLTNFINTKQDPFETISQEIPFINKQSQTIIGQCTITPLIHNDKYYFHLIIRDITNYRKSLQLLKNQLKEEQKNTALRKNFIASMSHELRSPMNSVLGMAEVLSETTLSDPQEKYVNTILNSGKNLLNIINDILDFSKFEAEGVSLSLKEIDLEKMAMEVLETLAFKASEKNLSLNFNISKSADKIIFADEQRLQQILINLINNAIKFTMEGEVNLWIGVEPKNNNEIIFQIEDTGLGIPQEDISKIFNEFAQTSVTKNKNIEGTGLGLAITKQIVMAMKGKLSVKSVLNKGTKFIISFPFKIKNKPEVDLAPPIKNILVIGDNITTLSVLKRNLTGLNIQNNIIDINNHQNILDEISKYKDNFIILALSNKNNIDLRFAARLKDLKFNMSKVVFHTKISNNNINKSKIIQLGISSFLHSPYSKSNLIEVFNNLLKNETTTKNNTKPKIVLIDDNPEYLSVINSCLKSEQINIQSFESPVIAYKYIMDNNVDLIITDYAMKETNGINLINNLIKNKKNLPPIILMSGYDLSSQINTRKNIIFLEKTTTHEELRQTVYDLIKISSNKSPPTPAPKKTKSPINEHSILIVDDIKENRELLKIHLSNLGFSNLCFAPNGKEALSQLLKKPFDLVLMDLQMPVLDGHRATIKIRELEKNGTIKKTKIVALSADSLSEDKQRSLSQGFDYHLNKPLLKKDLKELLNKVLNLKENL